MKLSDFNRLVKFMEMTTSINDGEALNAARMANKLLAANNADWKRVFARLITIEVEPGAGDVDPAPANRTPPGAVPVHGSSAAKTREQLDREAHINHMFDYCLQRVKSGDFRKFLLDVESQWQKKGRLSTGQYEAVKRTYDRHHREGA